MHPTVRFTPIDRLLGRRPREPLRRRPAAPAWFHGPAADAVGEVVPPLAAGWFESSAELRRGLAVLEGPCADDRTHGGAWPPGVFKGGR